MAKKDTFLGFHKSIAYVYQILGVAPVPYGEDSRITRTLAAVSCLIVLIFWIGVGFAFARDALPSYNTMSVISNYIQLLLNGTAFTVALVNPLWKYQDYQEIIKLFNQIDQQLEEVTTFINYRKHTKVFYIVTSAILALLSCNQGLSFYVYVIRDENEVSYWILASITLLFYAMSVHQAIVFIFCIHTRLQWVSELLTQKETDIVQVQCQICVGKCLELEDKEAAERFFHLIHDIYLLCGEVDDYFGPVFLTSLGALFAMASIQAFYCYTVVKEFYTGYLDPDEMWSLFCSVHLLVINLSLVVSLSCISELVTKDSNRILSYIMRAQKNNLVTI